MTTSDYVAIFGTLAAFLIGGIGTYVKSQITIAKMQVKIENLEKNHNDFTSIVKDIFEELKSINEKLHEKADRT